MSSTVASNDAKKVEILEGILDKAKRNYLCPACLKSFKRYGDLKDHIKRVKHSDNLEGLLDKEESTFRWAYERSIGWKATDEEPIINLPRDRNAAFTREFVVGKIVSQANNPVQTRIQTCLRIAVASGMAYVCPTCVDTDLEYFNKMVDFDNHCWGKNIGSHMGLLSKTPATFIPAYIRAMGLTELKNLPPGGEKPGRWTNARFLNIEYVFNTKW